MPTKSDHRTIESTIARFARAYRDLEDLQQQEAAKSPCDALLPHKGDQKTGLIGEYWAIRYARAIFPDAEISFGRTSEKGWDLKVQRRNGENHYIQIKTASAFGSGRLSPICPPKRAPTSKNGKTLADYWSELWLLWLGRDLRPITLWKLKPEHVRFQGNCHNTAKSIRRTPDDLTTGSDCFDWDKAQAITDLLNRVDSI
jgi:hypothetical protein